MGNVLKSCQTWACKNRHKGSGKFFPKFNDNGCPYSSLLPQVHCQRLPVPIFPTPTMNHSPTTLLDTLSPLAILALLLLLNYQDMLLPQGICNGCSLECSSIRYHHCSLSDLTISLFSKLIFTMRSIMTILFNLQTTLPVLLSSNSWMCLSYSILFVFSF